MATERLQKILAQAGVASRRAAERLIVNGKVRVNGKIVTELGAKATAHKDRIEVNGERIVAEAPAYYLLHKPRETITSLSDPEGRETIKDLMRGVPERVFPVGRLDFHTSGAILLTNDGDLAEALLRPKHGVPKVYAVKVQGRLEVLELDRLRNGVKLDDGYTTKKADVFVLREEGAMTWIQITLREGKNRQIHRMLEAIGRRVSRLARLSFADIDTEGLRPGEWRPLTKREIDKLQRNYAMEGVGPKPGEVGSSKPKRVAGPPKWFAAGAKKPRDGEEDAPAPRKRVSSADASIKGPGGGRRSKVTEGGSRKPRVLASSHTKTKQPEREISAADYIKVPSYARGRRDDEPKRGRAAVSTVRGRAVDSARGWSPSRDEAEGRGRGSREDGPTRAPSRARGGRDEAPARGRSARNDGPPSRSRSRDDGPPSRAPRGRDDGPPSRSRSRDDGPPSRAPRGRDDGPPSRSRSRDDGPPSRASRGRDAAPSRGRSADAPRRAPSSAGPRKPAGPRGRGPR